MTAAFVEQARLVADAVAGLDDAEFGLPTRLGTWRVAELVAHLAANIEAVSRTLAHPEPARAETDLAGYLTATKDHAAGVAQRAVDRAAGRTPAALRHAVADAVATAERDLAAVRPDRLVLVRLGVIPLSDFLATRCVETVVHGLDLAAATGLTNQPATGALRVAVRALADMLVSAAPGRSVEVRIPGPAGLAVQCVPGPPHRRGTPPNVVETDPVTFLELATGRLSWTDAVTSGRLRASGARADLSAYLPLMA